MAPPKPARVARDEFQSAKWDELCRGRSFSEADVPSLALLCSWYQVAEQCMDDITSNGGMQVAYANDMGDIKALPQIATMKQASAEIRALNKQLGINDGVEVPDVGTRDNVLQLVTDRRKSRRAGAAG